MILEGSSKLPSVSTDVDSTVNQPSFSNSRINSSCHLLGDGVSDQLLSNLWSQLDRIQPTVGFYLVVIFITYWIFIRGLVFIIYKIKLFNNKK